MIENQLTDSFTLKYGATWTLEKLEKLSKMVPLKNYAISRYDRKFMAAFLKCFNESRQKHIALYNPDGGGHVDLITTMKSLVWARFYCYACHKAYSTSKHMCPASSCVDKLNVKIDAVALILIK